MLIPIFTIKQDIKNVNSYNVKTKLRTDKNNIPIGHLNPEKRVTCPWGIEKLPKYTKLKFFQDPLKGTTEGFIIH